MTAQTQACLERVPGTLERGGLAIYCGEWADCSRDIATEPRFSESAFQPVDFRGEA